MASYVNQFLVERGRDEGCDPEFCTDVVGGEHAPTCVREPEPITPDEFRAIQHTAFGQPREELAEVWCANDDRASVGRINEQFLCSTCYVVAYAEAAR